MNDYKKDAKLGKDIEEYLTSLRMNTPMKEPHIRQSIEAQFESIMEALCCDLSDDSLQDTPRRVGKMYGKEIFYGMDPNNFPKCTTVNNKFGYSDLVTIKDIKVRSMCEHHFMPIFGTATVAYIPNRKVMGLSKFNRIVDYFSRRPQVQERLTNQIAHSLKYILETDDVAVVIKADHFCTKMRGVEQDSQTVTSKMMGRFFDNPSLRAELMGLL